MMFGLSSSHRYQIHPITVVSCIYTLAHLTGLRHLSLFNPNCEILPVALTAVNYHVSVLYSTSLFFSYFLLGYLCLSSLSKTSSGHFFQWKNSYELLLIILVRDLDFFNITFHWFLSGKDD